MNEQTRLRNLNILVTVVTVSQEQKKNCNRILSDGCLIKACANREINLCAMLFSHANHIKSRRDTKQQVVDRHGNHCKMQARRRIPWKQRQEPI